MSFSQSRRRFIKSLSLVAVGAVSGQWISSAFAAAKKTVTTTAEQAKAAFVDVKKADTKTAKPADTMAKALKYVNKSTDATKKCSSCIHFSQGVDAAGKDVQMDVPGAGKQAVGACALFAGGYVAAEGSCMSWFKAA